MFRRGVVGVIQPGILDGSPHFRHFVAAISYRDTAIHGPAAAITWKAQQAIKDASDIEYTLSFKSSPESRKEINVVTQKQGLRSYRNYKKP